MTTFCTLYRSFQHTAARRRLVAFASAKPPEPLFQHTAARRRLDFRNQGGIRKDWFQHTAARRRLGNICECMKMIAYVSTHSRPKAAGVSFIGRDGGFRFQHTAARRRLVESVVFTHDDLSVSTHSRPKAAGEN